MSALLNRLAAEQWVLTGAVAYNLAETLADALELQQGKTCIIHLQDATGGAALLLVLLSWQRKAQQLGVNLQFIDPSPELMRVAQLSRLDELLPFVPSAH